MSQKVELLKVVSVEPDGEEDCICIAVADPSRLYATASGILTHNTTPPAPTGIQRRYEAVTGALDNLREGMKLVKSTEDERTAQGVNVPDTQYRTRSFEDMKPLAEAVIDGWQEGELSGAEVLTLLRTGEHSASNQRLEPGERMLILNSLSETGRFRDFGVLQSDLGRVVQEVVGDSGFAMRAAQEFLDPVTKMKAEADAETDTEIKKIVGVDKGELLAELESEVNAEQGAELEKVIRELQDKNSDLQEALGRDAATRKAQAEEVKRLKKLLNEERAKVAAPAPVAPDVGALKAQIGELEGRLDGEVKDRLQRAEELARLRGLLTLAEAKNAELAALPADRAEADKRLADEVLKSRERVRLLTQQLAEAEALFARASTTPAAAAAMDTFNKWILGEKVPGVPSIEDLAKKYLTLSRFNREGFRKAITRLFPALNGDVLDLALDRIVEELEGQPKAKDKTAVAPKKRSGGAASSKGDVDAAEKTLRQLYEEDGAKRMAAAFFRGGDKKTGTKAALGEGNSLLNAELTRVLNESLDALGIERKTMPKDPQDVFRQVAVAIGLDDLRAGKMKQIDDQVRLQIEEKAGDNSELAQDMIEQWEAISAGMLGNGMSGTIARRVSHLLLGERSLSPADLASKTDAEVRAAAELVGKEAAKRVAAIPTFGGVAPADVANVQATVTGTVLAMVERVREARKKAEALRKSPKQVTKRAAAIVDRLAADFSDTPSWSKKATPDALRALVSEAIRSEEEMADLRERAAALGVSDEVASQLVSMVMEARRRRESIAEAARLSRLAEVRKRAITRMIDKLEGRVKPKHHVSLGKFLGSLQRASDWGILDADTFTQAFASAFALNGMTAARVQQLHALWHQLRNGDVYGMVRETLERQFLDAVNAVSPASRWDNVLFSAFMSKVLSSFSSIVNQFDGLTRIISPLTAITNGLYARDPAAILSNYSKGLSRLAKGLPFWLTGVRGESLGHLPSEVGPGFMPGEMQLNRVQSGGSFRVRLPGGRVVQLSPTTTQVLRWMELYSWRAIRGAEGLVGSSVDARSSYELALTQHYTSTGMKPADARRQALRDIAAGPADIAAAMAQAKSEQASGLIGKGEHVAKRRAEEIIQKQVDTRLGVDAAERAAQFTSYMNFKTDPVGPMGYIATQIVKLFIPSTVGTGPVGIGRVTRFWLMFPRFFGNLVDRSIGYVPGLHLLNRFTSPMVEKKIVEIFGSKENYNRFNDARAGAGLTVAVLAAALLGLSKALNDDEDEEPWFDITGSLPSASREEKARLEAAGRWSETTLKIGGLRLNYASFGELSPVLTMIGNVNDYLSHGGNAGDYTAAGAGYQVLADTVMAPVRRSTYKQWLQLISNLGGGVNAQQGEAGVRNAYALLTQPIGGFTKLPVVTDLDRLYKGGDALVARSLGDKILAKIPFVKVGDVLITPYGERVQGLPFLGILGDAMETGPDVLKAARLNLDTGTQRSIPQAPDVAVDDAQAAVFQEMAGKLYVSGMVKNEKLIRDKLAAGDVEEVEYIVRSISAMANASAKSKAWPEVYGEDAKKEALKAAMQERKENKKGRKNDATDGVYILPP